MQKKTTSSSAFLNLRSLIYVAAACSILTGTLLAYFRPDVSAKVSQRTLTFTERMVYQRAIEDVYWRHRIWPKANAGSKPPLDKVMSHEAIEKKVEDYLRNSQALHDYWQHPITPEQLQAEMERMAQHTKQPEMLRELFTVLGNDPFVIAECLARPVLAERRARELYARDGSASDRKQNGANAVSNAVSEDQRAYYAAAVPAQYTLPAITSAPNGCDHTWTPTNVPFALPARYLHTAVWTGTEMIIWGGNNGPDFPAEGDRYNPTTDSWTAASTTNAPDTRDWHTAVWTGVEMIVWGGSPFGVGNTNTGGRYNPGTDTWTATSTTNAPTARAYHTAVWTGSEMIVWGGASDLAYENTGGRYNPATNSWTACADPDPSLVEGRYYHTAIWSGTEMIVWGGAGANGYLNTGGRYNPSSDTWTATSFNNPPDARFFHTAVWTGTEMIVWGGNSDLGLENTGGRYNPGTNTWTATRTTNAPDPRVSHMVVWTASEMIVWGGNVTSGVVNTGGRYSPATNTWIDTSTTNAPTPRAAHTAVWTGSEMIVWGGFDPAGNGLQDGGRYCGQAGPTPTPTPTATPTATPTPTPCTGRCNPTPRPRPTPHRRPTPH